MLNAIMRLHAAHVSSKMPPRIRLRTAYHEAGHGYFMTRSNLWKNVRIRLNDSGGLASGKYDRRDLFSDAEAGWLIARMTVAGAVAEQLFFGNYSKLGAAQDMANALELISGRESAMDDYIDDNFLPTSFEAVQDVVPPDTSIRAQRILGGAVVSVARELLPNIAKVRALGKELFKKSYLSDKEIRNTLEVSHTTNE